MKISPALLDQLTAVLGASGVREQADEVLPDLILKPATTQQVSDVLRLCDAARQALIPLGGKSGLAGGHHATGNEIGLSLERMNAIEEVDTQNRTMTVQAGCILQIAAEAAQDEGLLLPLDLGARGTATVGGNVATNAGGNMVIRYGMTREMILGLEVVLADGTVLTSLNKLLKNNTGYDLRQWFIGAEGTLGVITRVVLRLRPQPKSQNTALLAVDDFASVAALLRNLDSRTAGTLTAYEVMWSEFYDFVTRQGSVHTPPLPRGSAHYVLVETQGCDPTADAEHFQTVLFDAMEAGLVADAVVAQSGAERNALWEIRDDVLSFFSLGPVTTFDISVTIDCMEAFVEDIRSAMAETDDAICIIFGHVGDGNLHLILGNQNPAHYDQAALEAFVYGSVERYGGSVSAEHGIGLSKRDHLHRSRSAQEIQLMIRMKNMLDPHNTLNPNKILSADQLNKP